MIVTNKKQSEEGMTKLNLLYSESELHANTWTAPRCYRYKFISFRIFPHCKLRLQGVGSFSQGRPYSNGANTHLEGPELKHAAPDVWVEVHADADPDTRAVDALSSTGIDSGEAGAEAPVDGDDQQPL